MGMMDFAPPKVEADSSSISNNRRKKEKTSNEFSMDDFYYLFATQLQNQDMMNPVDNSQFLMQMSQMAMIQAMDRMNEMTMTSYAFEFMGKEVIVAQEDKDGNLQSIEGTVERVTLFNGKPEVVVNGVSYQLEQVMEVLTPAKDDSLDLIGREVAYGEYDDKGNFIKDKDGNIVLTTGVIDKATYYDGKTVFHIGDKTVTRDQILEIMPTEADDSTIIWPEEDEAPDKIEPDKEENLDPDQEEGQGGVEGNDNETGNGSVTPPTTGGEGSETPDTEEGGTPPVQGGEGGSTNTEGDTSGDGETPDANEQSNQSGDSETTPAE